MISGILKKTTLPLLSRQLDMNSLRHKVIANNIANVNTPNYLSKDIEFDKVLDETSKRLHVSQTHSEHLPVTDRTSYKIIEDADRQIKNGINNVDIDKQMVELARNQMEFEFGGTMLSRLFKSIKSVISERVE